jgi:hypothetical protein
MTDVSTAESEQARPRTAQPPVKLKPGVFRIWWSGSRRIFNENIWQDSKHASLNESNQQYATDPVRRRCAPPQLGKNVDTDETGDDFQAGSVPVRRTFGRRPE